MSEHLQNAIELTFTTCIILFIDPFSIVGITKLLAGALIVFVGRVSSEVFLTRPLTKFLRNVKKKLIANLPKPRKDENTEE